jgi:hypothetical protein
MSGFRRPAEDGKGLPSSSGEVFRKPQSPQLY